MKGAGTFLLTVPIEDRGMVSIISLTVLEAWNFLPSGLMFDSLGCFVTVSFLCYHVSSRLLLVLEVDLVFGHRVGSLLFLVSCSRRACQRDLGVLPPVPTCPDGWRWPEYQCP